MSATFSSQNPSAAGQQSVPPGHSPHHGGPPPGHPMHGGGPPGPGGMPGPVPNGVPGQSSPHHGPPPSQYPSHHPPGPPSSMPNGYNGQPSGAPGAPPSSTMPSQQANPQVIQKVSRACASKLNNEYLYGNYFIIRNSLTYINTFFTITDVR